MPNSLVNSLSPYLRQHANNPVDWHNWDSAALEKARNENKPIFLSIGYSACHWCHVMAHESFEDPETASIMNEHFVNIKVDREERPDLDDIYMAAVVALTGQGGWPMSVFLTPDLKPFYGGTYFPPESRYGLPSFKQVLLSLAHKWETERDDILQAGKNLTSHLQQISEQSQNNSTITPDALNTATEVLIKSYDWQSGGWGNAPKFPQPMALEFLLRRHAGGNSGALSPVLHALRAMTRGGMYDIAGGGFARYSTDRDWLVPHFEKMLYDNALLTRVYLHAWQITREPAFRKVVDETLQFIIREMTDPDGGFYSSLDADSEGVEGKYYVWTIQEIREVLGKRDDLFETAFGLNENGNWEGKNILRRDMDDPTLAARFKLDESEVESRLRHSLDTLLTKRGERVRPGTDDKVLASWNGLILAAFAEAARILDNGQYLEVARKNGEFLLGAMLKEDGLRHAWREGQTGQDSFLEDYSACILGFLELYQADHNTRWYQAADTLSRQMVTQFSDQQGGFFDTPEGAEIVLSRPKNLQDNAVPSGNALAAEALLKMAEFSENSQYRTLAENMFRLAGDLAADHPTGFARWLSAADMAASRQRKQIAIVGSPDDPRTKALMSVVNSQYSPDWILTASNVPLPEGSPQVLIGREMIGGMPTAYVCEQFVCKQPVTSPEELMKVLGIG